MQEFFTITIPVYTLSFMDVMVEWNDLPKRKSKKVTVTSKEEYIIKVLSIETAAFKDILKRYLNQRYKAEVLPAKYVQEVKEMQALNDLCVWVRKNESVLISSLPNEDSQLHNWRKIIIDLIDFASTYREGDGRKAAIQQISNTNYYGNNT